LYTLIQFATMNAQPTYSSNTNECKSYYRNHRNTTIQNQFSPA
jgi:hypothetical protein